ncbi:MAG: hypothetical protein EBU08_23645, partial [Micrococcales bacterium]|nr:hypothetical protein [Micrococcales bacterium]
RALQKGSSTWTSDRKRIGGNWTLHPAVGQKDPPAPTWSQVAEKVFATAEEHTDDLSLTQQERAAWNDLSVKQQEILQKEAMKIHLNTSHQAPRVLATNLRQAGAKLTSVAAMKLLKCDTCLEEKDPLPRPPANIQEPESRVPWEILGMDVKEVVEPRLDERIRYLVMMDEVSKFSRFVELFTTPAGQSRNATEAEVLKAYEDGWSTIFGDPRIIRHDEEGALKGNKFLETLAGRNIKLDVIAGEAHWQLGVTERMIGTIMRVAERVCSEIVCTMREAIRGAVAAHNTVEDAHGYTPSQWAFGKQPKWHGNLWRPESEEEVPLAKMSNQAYQEGLQRQLKA